MRGLLTLASSAVLLGVLFAGRSIFPASERKPDAAVPGSASNVVEKKTPSKVAPGSGQRCPGTAKLLVGVSTFSTLVGATGCVTPSAEAFLILFRSRDLDGFRLLAKSSAAGAQLYALCGFKHLRAESEAKALRELVAAKKGQQLSTFDSMCDYLIEEEGQPHRRPCDTGAARPKCE
jgi:hypothetical protein